MFVNIIQTLIYLLGLIIQAIPILLFIMGGLGFIAMAITDFSKTKKEIQIPTKTYLILLGIMILGIGFKIFYMI